MKFDDIPIEKESIENYCYVFLWAVVTALLIFSMFFLMGQMSSTATSAVVIEDSSEEGIYYTQISPRENIIRGTVETTTSVYVSLEESTNIKAVTTQPRSLQQNELYSNENFTGDEESSGQLQSLQEQSRSAQLVKLTLEDPDEPAEIVIIGEPEDSSEKEVAGVVSVNPEVEYSLNFDVPNNKSTLFTDEELNRLTQG
jgi:hypothetical protein